MLKMAPNTPIMRNILLGRGKNVRLKLLTFCIKIKVGQVYAAKNQNTPTNQYKNAILIPTIHTKKFMKTEMKLTF